MNLIKTVLVVPDPKCEHSEGSNGGKLGWSEAVWELLSGSVLGVTTEPIWSEHAESWHHQPQPLLWHRQVSLLYDKKKEKLNRKKVLGDA